MTLHITGYHESLTTIFLNTFSSVALAFFRHVPETDEVKNDAEQLMVSPTWVPFPLKVRFRPYEARRLLSYCGMVNASGWSDTCRTKVVVEGCNAVAIKSSIEVEPEWLSLLPKIYSKPVIPGGLLPPAAPVEERGELKIPTLIIFSSVSSSRDQNP